MTRWPDRRRAAGRALALLLLGLAGCEDSDPAGAALVSPLGDAERGRQVIADVACGVCHDIPGVAGARGILGPPLSRFGRRGLIAGGIPNTPANLVAWLDDPPRLKPDTGMPDVGLTATDARHVAAYLISLR